jgi:hypothetical protein
MNPNVAIAGVVSVYDLLCLILVAISAVVLKALFSFLYMLLIRPLFDPLRHIPGPEGMYFQTHLRQVME